MNTTNLKYQSQLKLPCDNGGKCPIGATSREDCLDFVAKYDGLKPPCQSSDPGIIRKSLNIK